MSRDVSSDEDWEDLQPNNPLNTSGYELGPDLQLINALRSDSNTNALAVTPTRMTYAQALGQKLNEGQK